MAEPEFETDYRVPDWWPTGAITLAYQLRRENDHLRAELAAEREGRAKAWDAGYRDHGENLKKVRGYLDGPMAHNTYREASRDD